MGLIYSLFHLRFIARLPRAIKSQRATVQLHAATLSHEQTKPTRLITIFLVLGSSLFLVGCLAKRKRTINRRIQKRLNVKQCHHFGTVFVKEDRETGSGAEAVSV